MPRDDEEYPALTKFALQHVPMWRSNYRAALMQRSESFWVALTQKDTSMSEELRQWCLGHMHTQLPGREDLWKKLTPDYVPGCKRILITNDFYPTLLQDNVHVETAGIQRFDEDGVILAHGRKIELDCIVLATGFETNDFLGSYSIKGTDTRTLQMRWKEEGVQTLYGVLAESMPNFYMLYGPNTNLAHNSIILMIEAQSRYIRTLITKVASCREEGQSLTITPKAQRLEQYDKELQKQLSVTSFADSKCQSWYKTADGKVTNNWSRNVVDYQQMLSKVDWTDFELSGPYTDTFSKSANSRGDNVRSYSRHGLKCAGGQRCKKLLYGGHRQASLGQCWNNLRNFVSHGGILDMDCGSGLRLTLLVMPSLTWFCKTVI